MPFLKFSRDKRGYENYYLYDGKGRPRLLFWFRTPPQVKVGRVPFSDEVRTMVEAQNPGVSFDWARIMSTPIPSPDVDHWRERRRVEKAAKRAAREAEAVEAAEAAEATGVTGGIDVTEAADASDATDPAEEAADELEAAEIAEAAEVAEEIAIHEPQLVAAAEATATREDAEAVVEAAHGGPTETTASASENQPAQLQGHRRRRRRRRGRRGGGGGQPSGPETPPNGEV